MVVYMYLKVKRNMPYLYSNNILSKGHIKYIKNILKMAHTGGSTQDLIST